jgi:hypothetical protein
MSVVVTGIGLVSPLGDSPEALHDALCRGESGLAPVEGIETGDVSPPPVGQVRGFVPAAYLGRGNFRPLDRTGRMATAAASLALAAGGEGRPAPEDPRQAVPPREREIGLAGYILLRLPLTVEPVFLEWLERTQPDKRAKVEGRIRNIRGGKLSTAKWGERMQGRGQIADQIKNLFQICARNYGLNKKLPPLDTSQFQRPDPDVKQLKLF